MAYINKTKIEERLNEYQEKLRDKEQHLSSEAIRELRVKIKCLSTMLENCKDDPQRIYFKKSNFIVFIEWVLVFMVGYYCAKHEFLNVAIMACLLQLFKLLQPYVANKYGLKENNNN